MLGKAKDPVSKLAGKIGENDIGPANAAQNAVECLADAQAALAVAKADRATKAIALEKRKEKVDAWVESLSGVGDGLAEVGKEVASLWAPFGAD
jgi:hypothetical protein